MYNFTVKSKDDFLSRRAEYIGSSDIPVLAGYTQRYTREINGQQHPVTPLVLWMEKTGRVKPFPGNEATYWGNKLEAALIDHFLDSKGLVSSFFNSEFRHPDYLYAVAHPDLLWHDGQQYKDQEIKTSTFFASRRGDNPDYGYDPDDLTANGIPASVYLQVQWQLFCSDIQEAGVSILTNTSTYREYGPIRYNQKVIEKLLARADKFWWHVQNDTPPDPETWGDVKLIFPRVEKTAAVISGEQEEKIRLMKEQASGIKEKIRKLKKQQDDIKNAIGIFIGGNQVLTDAGGEELAKQSLYSRESLNLSGLKKDNPELYDQLQDYIKKTEIRRLTF
jgi:predicted phage-related endonuclease